MGKWYFIRFEHSSWSYDDESSGTWETSEVVFVSANDSIAKYVRKKCLAGMSYTDANHGYRGFDEGSHCYVKELSLLLPDGTKISGFKPKSLEDLFIDSEKKFSLVTRYWNIYRSNHPDKVTKIKKKKKNIVGNNNNNISDLDDNADFDESLDLFQLARERFEK